MIAGEMQTMRKEMEQEFAAKLGKVYDEVRTEQEQMNKTVKTLPLLGLCVGVDFFTRLRCVSKWRLAGSQIVIVS